MNIFKKSPPHLLVHVSLILEHVSQTLQSGLLMIMCLLIVKTCLLGDVRWELENTNSGDLPSPFQAALGL